MENFDKFFRSVNPRVRGVLNNTIKTGDDCRVLPPDKVTCCGLQENTRGYLTMSVMYPGKRSEKHHLHKIVFELAYRKFFPFNTVVDGVSKRMHVSHTCHNKQCLNYKHMQYESITVNNNRQRCRNGNRNPTPGRCMTHREVFGGKQILPLCNITNNNTLLPAAKRLKGYDAQDVEIDEYELCVD